MKESELIYQEYFLLVYNFLYRIANCNSHLAEELTQETFYQAFLSLHRFNGKCKISTWLCQIAKNCYFKHLRRSREIPMDFSLMADELFDEKTDIQADYEKKYLKETLRKAILALGRKYRNVFILRIYFECSFQEIGRLLNISEGAAKVIFYRGKEKLKAKF